MAADLHQSLLVTFSHSCIRTHNAIKRQPTTRQQLCNSIVNILTIEMTHLPPPAFAPAHVTEFDRYDQPWKYIGYKSYAWLLSSDDDFLMFRRFGTLNARVLLSMQDDLVVAEEKLKELDSQYSQKDAPRQHNGSFRLESAQQTERKELLLDIKNKLKEYSVP